MKVESDNCEYIYNKEMIKMKKYNVMNWFKKWDNVTTKISNANFKNKQINQYVFIQNFLKFLVSVFFDWGSKNELLISLYNLHTWYTVKRLSISNCWYIKF